MRINQFVALAAGVSRREADRLVEAGKIEVNSKAARLGMSVEDQDQVTLDGKPIVAQEYQYFALNKPIGYVCSRARQGETPTIYDLLPEDLQHLKAAGRLDKDSSGLLLLSNDGNWSQQLTHPKHHKEKIYQVKLDRDLSPQDKANIESGVDLDDGVSRMRLVGGVKSWQITMHEGRNRQIRRTFAALGYKVLQLHRTNLGRYSLNELGAGQLKQIER